MQVVHDAELCAVIAHDTAHELLGIDGRESDGVDLANDLGDNVDDYFFAAKCVF